MTPTKKDDLQRWDAAIGHARLMFDIYKGLPGGIGLYNSVVIKAAINFYDKGDRSKQVHYTTKSGVGE